MCRNLFLAALCLSCAACTRVVVHKDPGPHDKGIRYYRPKPYLFITPGEGGGGSKATFAITQGQPLKVVNETAAAGEANVGSSVTPAAHQAPDAAPAAATGPTALAAARAAAQPTKVSIELVHMPDFAEEYSIQLRPGLGVGELNVKLDNGWNLTSVGIKTDQQTDEIIKSVADLVGSVGGILKPSAAGPAAAGQGQMRVLATNIPFGFYEAVIAADPYGRKQLYGWRYIGFMPFQACPVRPAGGATVCCDDPSAIYGMVMDKDGILRFEQIATIPTLPTAAR